MEARAVTKYLKISAHKVRPVIAEVRDRPVAEALAQLSVSPRKAARLLEKVIQSAVANLKGKEKTADHLIRIKKAFADEGPLNPPFKHRARARGMASRIRNRTCHITVVVEGAPEKEKKRATAAVKQKARRKTDGTKS